MSDSNQNGGSENKKRSSKSGRRDSTDRRKDIGEWVGDERRANEESRRSYIGRRQAAEWRHGS